MRRYKSELSWRPLVQNGAAQNIINAAAATTAPKVKRSESEYCFTTLVTSLQVEIGCHRAIESLKSLLFH
jgi:hypothetical protein